MKYSETAGTTLYEPGDRVRVVSKPYRDGELVRTGVGEYKMDWISDMDDLCGGIVTIETVDEVRGTYSIKEAGYSWCNAFFEPIISFVSEDEEDSDMDNVDSDNFLSSFCVR